MIWHVYTSLLTLVTSSRPVHTFVPHRALQIRTGLVVRLATPSEEDSAAYDPTENAQDMEIATVVRKSHQLTVCMVPPESFTEVWEMITRARTELRDPGLYRWPPHANLLYPFQDIKTERGDSSKGLLGVLDKLQNATRQCEPFTCKLSQLGTFGGRQRGVLWIYPESAMQSDSGSLHLLQSKLQEEFPFCNDQRKTGGEFNPHMTLSHFVNLESALDAKKQIETWWPSDMEFPVQDVYLLERKGDDGQFLRIADIGLGQKGKIKFHQEPIAFQGMPSTEADWVRNERMKLKARRKKSGGRRQRSRRRSRSRGPRVPDSPEVIEQKRKERREKREQIAKLRAEEMP